MEALSVFWKCLFEQPSSTFIRAMAVLTLPSAALLAVSEVSGFHLSYSKFWNVKSQKSWEKRRIKVPARVGMFAIYLPAFLAGLVSFWLFPDDGGIRFVMAKSTVTIHFLKRLLEVVFIHKYSSSMFIDSVLVIMTYYFFGAASILYAQSLTKGFQEPSIDLKYLGILMFLVGISGNFYHHYLLSNLRRDGQQHYKIPKGGLFDLVVCPHYLFEIIGLLGISFVCQTLVSFSFSIGSAMYLSGRSYMTRKWYRSKYEDFPSGVRALIPFVF